MAPVVKALREASESPAESPYIDYDLLSPSPPAQLAPPLEVPTNSRETTPPVNREVTPPAQVPVPAIPEVVPPREAPAAKSKTNISAVKRRASLPRKAKSAALDMINGQPDTSSEDSSEADVRFRKRWEAARAQQGKYGRSPRSKTRRGRVERALRAPKAKSRDSRGRFKSRR